MKEAQAFLNLLDRDYSPDKALASLPQCELPYISKIPVGVYLAAHLLGWQFFPAPRLTRSGATRLRIDQASSNLDQLKQWARSRPQWALATGAISGVFVVVVHGDTGRNSLLDLCEDDWDWLFTLRTQAGAKRYIFYAWPENRQQIPRSVSLGQGLSILGDGDWLLYPPSRESGGARHVCLTRSIAVQPPKWLLDRMFNQQSAAEPVSIIPPLSDFGTSPRQVLKGEDRP
ncbi:MAG: bifunctional DNA primase/polymerase [Terracidiphilus sp.]